jgi:hypothetical protein
MYSVVCSAYTLADLSPNFTTLKEPRNGFQGIDSASLIRLAESIPSTVQSRQFFASTLREQLFELKNEDAI